MHKKVPEYFFNQTNKYVRETSHEGSKEDIPNKLKRMFAMHGDVFGCQTKNVKNLLTIYYDLPKNFFGKSAKAGLPVGVFAKTTHSKPRLVLSIGGGLFIDPEITGDRPYRTDQLTLDFVHKAEVIAFCEKNAQRIDERIPVTIL